MVCNDNAAATGPTERAPDKRRRAGKKAWAVWALAALLAAGVAAWLGGRILGGAPGGNILLVTLDTTRADRLGCYGYAAALTPTLDDMARQGVLWEHAFSCVPLTLPAHASILTGGLPPEHGLHINGEGALARDVPTLATQFAAAGYRTGAFIASYVLNNRFGLARGFDVYNDQIDCGNDGEEGLRSYRPGDQVVDAALDWLRQPGQKPFFCWVHLFDPHKPYHEHRDRFGARFAGRPYDAEVAFADQQVGRLLGFLRQRNLLQRTLVVAVGDHGEGLGDHGEMYHGNFLYNSTLHVPLIFYGHRALAGGRRITGRISIVDLFPTLLEWAGSPVPSAPSARSAVPVLRGRKPAASRPCYAETDEPFRQYGWHALRCLVDGSWKYIRSPQRELYDLQTDPAEKGNLEAVRPATADQLERQLGAWEASLGGRSATALTLSPEEQRNLASLGYTAGRGTAAAGTPQAGGPDVKDMMGLLNDMMRSKALQLAGRHDEVLPLRRRAVEQDPNNLTFQFLLAEALHNVRQYEEAEQRLQRMLEEDTARRMTPIMLEDSFSLLAKCYYEQRRYAESEAALQKALEIVPDSLIALNGLAWVQATRPDGGREQREDALTLARSVIAVHGERNPAYLDTLAVAQAAVGDFAGARQTAEKALQAARARDDLDLAETIARRLECYRADRPAPLQ